MRRRTSSSSAAVFVVLSCIWTSAYADTQTASTGAGAAAGSAGITAPATMPAPDSARLAARALAEKGDLAFGSGRCDKATPIWREADQTFPAPTLKLRIAHCDALLGKVVESAAQLQAIVDTQLAADAPQPWIDAKKQAENELPATRSRIAKLDIDAKTAQPIQKITIDDTVRPSDGHGFMLDPGHHRIELASGSATAEHSFDLLDGDSKTLTAKTYLEPAPEPSHTGRTIGLSFGAAGVASLAVGTIFGVSALNISHGLDTDCPKGRSSCNPSEDDRISTLKTHAILSDVFLGAGVALVGVGAFFFVKDLKMEKAPPIPRITITGTRLVVDTSF